MGGVMEVDGVIGGVIGGGVNESYTSAVPFIPCCDDCLFL